jgi:pentatricopeptide repeat protein
MKKAGFEADTISYNTVIKACADACEVAKAEHWMSEMRKVGVEATTISYDTVIKACAETRDVAKAEHGLSEMTRLVSKQLPSATAR